MGFFYGISCYMVRCIPMFWGNLLPAAEEIFTSFTLKMEAAGLFGVLLSVYQTTQYYISEDYCLSALNDDHWKCYSLLI
jgi:hypothetical protein